MLSASTVAEKAGFPSVSIITDGFMGQAKVIAKGLGLPDLAIAVYPGVPMTDSKEALREKTENVLLKQIVEILAKPAEVKGLEAIEPNMKEIVFKGTLAEVNEYFYDKSWTDGLPIIPPSIEKVEEFLRFTDRSPDEIIGIAPPENREATIWNIAVNGLMAGCRPEYMPVLIAIVEALLEPEFRLQDAGSTPGWEPLIIINGPIIKKLDFNFGSGVMRIGRRANTSLGRFLKLYMRNVAGFRAPPGLTDKGSIGQSFLVALAEDEDTVAEIGWKSFSVEHGYKYDENVVTVQSVVGISIPIYSGGDRALDHMEIIGETMGYTCAFWSCTGPVFGRWHPLMVIGPSVAKVIAKDGWTKQDIKKYLHENVKIPAGLMEKYAWNIGLTGFSLLQQVEDGVLPKDYCRTADADRNVPVFMKPEWIGVVVAGDKGRNQSKGYVQNHIQGPPVSKKI